MISKYSNVLYDELDYVRLFRTVKSHINPAEMAKAIFFCLLFSSLMDFLLVSWEVNAAIF